MTALLLAAILAAEPQPPRVQWLVFGAEWCKPCREAKADYYEWMRKSGWKFGDNYHVRFFDVDKHQVEMVHREIETLPTFVLIRDGKEIRRYTTYPGRRVLVDDYLECWKGRK